MPLVYPASGELRAGFRLYLCSLEGMLLAACPPVQTLATSSKLPVAPELRKAQFVSVSYNPGALHDPAK